MVENLYSLLLIAFIIVFALAYYFLSKIAFNGRVILITGCDSGLGFFAAKHLQSIGFNVIATCLSAEGCERIINEGPKGINSFVLDVTDDRSVESAKQKVLSLHPQGIWGLMLNAGVGESSLIELTPLSTFERNMNVNYLGVVRVTKSFLPQIRSNEGRIIIISSFFGRGLSSFAMGPYAATKWAVEAFGDSLRQEMFSFGVKICLVEPGTMKTNLLNNAMNSMDTFYHQAPSFLKEKGSGGYGPEYLNCARRAKFLSSLLGSSPSSFIFLKPIEHAFTASHPFNRYLCGFDGWIMGGVFPLLPSFITDFIINLTVWPPKNNQKAKVS